MLQTYLSAKLCQERPNLGMQTTSGTCKLEYLLFTGNSQTSPSCFYSFKSHSSCCVQWTYFSESSNVCTNDILIEVAIKFSIKKQPKKKKKNKEEKKWYNSSLMLIAVTLYLPLKLCCSFMLSQTWCCFFMRLLTGVA